jgi:predicted TIM-barrel fold metal-dependent hydrolase
MNTNVHMATALPDGLRHLSGKILDPDTHEQMPAQAWAREIGPIMEELAHHWMNNGLDCNDERNHPNVPGYTADDKPITAETIWRQKGCASPGAVDIRRRLEVMDVMGIDRQLMFPTAGLFAIYFLYLNEGYGLASSVKRTDRKQYGYELMRGYNAWGKKVAKISDRIRPVLPVLAENIKDLYETARDLIDNGIRAIWMPSGVLPGGKSTAHPDLDPLWTMFEKHNVALMLHGGLDGRIFGADEWWDVPAFKGFRAFGEFRVDPWSMANTPTTTRNFLTTMILGGVFDRHPMLRVGIFEAQADWLGHLCENLDLLHKMDIGLPKGEKRTTYRLPDYPSAFVKRNVRIGAFFFEPVDKYISKYDMGDILCFSSDYPHVEGGVDTVNKQYELVKPFGDKMVEKFFVTNAEWLLPN